MELDIDDKDLDDIVFCLIYTSNNNDVQSYSRLEGFRSLALKLDSHALD